ncbi:MAG: anti-sigma factor family protein [Acidobacteriaceae bacterium]
MAIREEQLLAYLDGSLSRADHERLRAAIASEDQAAQLLRAHERLEGLYRLTAQPVNAPLDIQRELALKIPVLAAKLPYLAMPEDRKKRGTAGWWESFWAYRINAVLLLAVVLLAGGIWYAVHGRNLGWKRGNAIGQHGPAAPSAVLQTNEWSSASADLQASPVSPIRVATTAEARGGSFLRRAVSGIHSRRERGARFAARDRTSLNGAPAWAPALPAQPSDNALRAAHAQTDRAGTNSKLLPAPSEDLPPLHDVDPVTVPLVPVRASRAIPIPLSSVENENSYVPVHAFVEENVRIMRAAPQANSSEFARQFKGSIWTSNVLASSPEFGIDYELSPWFAVGLRGGDSRFLQAQPLVHSEPLHGYERVSKTVTETALLDPFALWTCIAGTFIANPGATLRFEFTGGAGNIFLGGVSPTALGEAAATFALTHAMELRGSILFQAAWVKSANPYSAPSVQAGSNTSVGSAVQSNTSSLYPSQSLGCSIGVTFHP